MKQKINFNSNKMTNMNKLNKDYYTLTETSQILKLNLSDKQFESLLIKKKILNSPGKTNYRYTLKVQAIHFEKADNVYCYLIEHNFLKTLKYLFADYIIPIPEEFKERVADLLLENWIPMELYKVICGAKIGRSYFLNFLVHENILPSEPKKGKWENTHIKTLLHKDANGKINCFYLMVNANGQRLIQEAYDNNFESWINNQLNTSNNG